MRVLFLLAFVCGARTMPDIDGFTQYETREECEKAAPEIAKKAEDFWKKESSKSSIITSCDINYFYCQQVIKLK